MSLDKLPYTLGLKTLDETLQQLKEPTKLVLVPRSPDSNQVCEQLSRILVHTVPV
jgi:hypothetical protein